MLEHGRERPRQLSHGIHAALFQVTEVALDDSGRWRVTGNGREARTADWVTGRSF